MIEKLYFCIAALVRMLVAKSRQILVTEASKEIESIYIQNNEINTHHYQTSNTTMSFGGAKKAHSPKLEDGLTSWQLIDMLTALPHQPKFRDME